MIKEITFFIFVTLLCRHATASKYFDPIGLINSLKRLSLEKSDGLCNFQTNCPLGFFCKNGDCVAKRFEGDSCLSSSDDECVCGKCILDPSTWSNICFSNSYCQDGGSTLYNTCESNSDCPDGYFCDALNGKVCTSRFAPGRACSNDHMCKCNKCEQILHKTRPNKPPISFNVCASC